MKIRTTHLGEDYGTIKINGEEFQVSLGLAEKIYELTKESPYIQCPLCDGELVHHEESGTHIYSCQQCSFIGIEWLNESDTRALENYLK